MSQRIVKYQETTSGIYLTHWAQDIVCIVDDVATLHSLQREEKQISRIANSCTFLVCCQAMHKRE